MAQVQDLAQQQRAGTLKMNPKEVLFLARSVAQIHRSAEEAARLALENERLRLGQPTHIIGVATEEITAEQAAEELAALMEEFQDGKPLAEEVIEARKNAQDVH